MVKNSCACTGFFRKSHLKIRKNEKNAYFNVKNLRKLAGGENYFFFKTCNKGQSLGNFNKIHVHLPRKAGK